MKAALFLSNDGHVLELLQPRDGNLAVRLVRETDSNQRAELLYLALLSRRPSPDEVKAVDRHPVESGADSRRAVSQLIWALLTSTEFCVNH